MASRKVPRLVLHIGLAKTGSTALQSFLYLNRERLLAQFGILYPGGEENHYFFPAYFSDHPHHLIQINRLGITEESTARAFLEKFISDFERELNQSHAQIVLLSSEYFAAMSEEELGRFRDYLEEIAEEVEVVAYVRDPWSFSLSWLQQNLRDGLWAGDIRPSYYRGNVELLDIFTNAFGIKPVVVPYVAINSKPFDVIDNFLHFIGIDGAGQFIRVSSADNKNAAMGRRALCIVSYLNKLFPSVDTDGGYAENPARDCMVERIMNSTNYEPIRLSRRTAEEILQAAKPDLYRIHEEYLGGDEVFFRAYGEARFSELDDLISIDVLERAELLSELFRTFYALAEQSLIERDEHIAKFGKELSAIQSTFSWKITAPLRWIRKSRVFKGRGNI